MSRDWVRKIEASTSRGDAPDWQVLLEAIGRDVDEADDVPTPEELRALFLLFVLDRSGRGFAVNGEVTTELDLVDNDVLRVGATRLAFKSAA